MHDPSPSKAPPPRIDGDELRAMMAEVSAFGGGPGGSLTRLALSAPDRAARDWLAAFFQREGLRLMVDGIGNMFGVLDWAGPAAPTVMSGSHLDSQPNGGCFDGALGVVAACAAARAIKRHAEAAGMAPKANLVVVDWTNEEGARFQPSLLGSGVYTGELDLAFALERVDGEGVRVCDALRQIGYAGDAAPPLPAAYVELHVECATNLERAGRRFAAFARFWGATKYRLAFHGRQAHTGPTPMADRRDALLAAARLAVALREMADRAGPELHTSMGRIEVRPNAPNVVPGLATCFIELRSASPDILAAAERDLLAAVDLAAAAALGESEVLSVDRRSAGTMDAGLVELASDVAAGLGHDAMLLDTIAGHDGVSMAAVCPSLVIAVPSRGGVLHHPSEFTADEDCLLGTRILTEMLWRFVCRGDVLEGARR